MNDRPRFLRLGLSCLLLILVVAGCNEVPDAAEHPVLGNETPPDQILYDSVVTDTRSGTRSWVLRSARMERWNDVDDAELHTVHMDFFKADTLYSTLTSQRGRADLKSQDLFAWGSVVVVTADGRRLETEELSYDDATGLITNDVFNRFTQGDDVMTGIGMEATPGLDRFELKQDVEADVATAAGDDS